MRTLTCMLVDIDHFKQINDRHGHQAGDAVLRQVAVLLGRDLRASDVLSRYGGEEFVLLLPSTTEAQSRAIAERIRSRIAQAAFRTPAGQVLAVTVSIGIAVRSGSARDIGRRVALAARGRRPLPGQTGGPKSGRVRLGKLRSDKNTLMITSLLTPHTFSSVPGT